MWLGDPKVLWLTSIIDIKMCLSEEWVLYGMVLWQLRGHTHMQTNVQTIFSLTHPQEEMWLVTHPFCGLHLLLMQRCVHSEE